MNFIKKLAKYFVTLVIILAAGLLLAPKTNLGDVAQVAQENYKAYVKQIFPCSRPLEYSIGSIDPRFNVSQEELMSHIAQAASVWEKEAGKKLFVYEKNSQFKINLIFDERQESTVEARKLEENLNNLELSHSGLVKKYQTLNTAYKKRIDDYNKSVADYEKQLKAYSKDVKYWNDQGGAPQDEYDKLTKKKKELKDTYSKLEKQRKEINQLIGQTNDVVKQENQLVSVYNSALNTYKGKYGATQEFEKGLFDGKEINIYQFKEISDLKLTFTHELGHYLGLNHMENPQSIMYYLMGDQNMNNPRLTDEDKTALKQVCRLD